MADNEVNAADKELNAIEFQLVKNEATVYPPDSLVAGPRGISYSEIIKIESVGSFKRGTVLMRVSGSQSFVPSTAEGLANAKEITILCDDIEIAEGEYAECAGYFGGDFNAAKVILPYESESDNHAELIEVVKPYLRAQGIFLR